MCKTVRRLLMIELLEENFQRAFGQDINDNISACLESSKTFSWMNDFRKDASETYILSPIRWTLSLFVTQLS